LNYSYEINQWEGKIAMEQSGVVGKSSRAKRLRYHLDNLVSRGPWVVLAWLGLAMVGVIVIVALVLTVTRLAPGGEAPYSFGEAVWLGLLRTLGGGSIGGRESNWAFRFLMLFVTIASLFAYSTVIGALTNGMRTNLEELRKGRSQVMERGHIVVLGWSDQIFTVLHELVQANASEKRACIVVLGEREKVEMEDAIHHKIGRTGRVRIVCRKGNPMEMADLRLVSLDSARVIVVLSPESANPDADVIKVVLAILNNPARRAEPYHIVATIRREKNAAVARVLGRSEVKWIRQGDVISRIIAQTSRQSGLSVVYNELLDFGGDEMYFYREPGLVGKTFGEAVLAAEHDVVVGLYRPVSGAQLNPGMKAAIEAGDQLIVVSKDNHDISFQLERAAAFDEQAIVPPRSEAPQPEHTLVLGWNWRGQKIIQELDKYVAPGSGLVVAANPLLLDRNIEKECEDMTNQQVCYQAVDTTERGVLEALGLENFHHVILLAYSDRLNMQQADALSLITLLHLRDIGDNQGLNFSIVTEMLDVRNRDLALSRRADDFIVSDRLISLLLAQVGENPELNEVFEDLLNPEGAELYLRPACLYVQPGVEVDFYTVTEAARRRGEVAVGYRQMEWAYDAGRRFGVVLNPHKAQRFTLAENDRVVVLSRG
jgi:voltage-gated potassium channel Kch